jgi:hypothetical protein
MKIYKQNGEIVNIPTPKPIQFSYHWARAGMVFIRNTSGQFQRILKDPTSIKEIHLISRDDYDGVYYDLMRVVFNEKVTFCNNQELFLGVFNSGTYDPDFIIP